MKKKLIMITIVVLLCAGLVYVCLNYNDIKFKYFINENNAKALIEERLSDKYNEDIKVIDINISKEYYNYFDSEDETLVFEGTAYSEKNKGNIFNYSLKEGSIYVEDDYGVNIYSNEVENKLEKELVLLNTNFINSYKYNIEYLKDTQNVTSLEQYILRDIVSFEIEIVVNENASFNEYYGAVYNTCKNIFNEFSTNISICIKTKKSNQIIKDAFCSTIYVDGTLEKLKKLDVCFD